MEAGRVSRSFQVRCLPEGFPAWSFRKLRKFPPGLVILGSVPGRGHPPFVAIFDHAGVPRWWIRSSTRALNAQILSNGTIVWSRGFGDGYGRDKRMGQEIRTLGGKLVRVVRMKRGITDPHELWEDRNGNILIESYVPRGPVDLSRYGGPARAQVVSPRIEVQSARGKLLDSLNLAQRLTTRDTRAPWWPVILRSPRPGTGGLQVFDITHMNSIEPWKKQFVVSARHTDAVFGISRRTGAVRWKLGGNKTPRSLRVIGAPFPDAELFGGQHDARIYGKRTLTVFDNATLRDRAPSGAVYRLDLKNRTARFVRRLVDPVAPRGNCCGSMRMIPGGWLVGFGDTPLTTGFTGKGKVAFRLRWSNSYRAVPVPPGTVTLRQLGRGLERLEDVPPPRPLR
jgi:hypothetical protein